MFDDFASRITYGLTRKSVVDPATWARTYRIMGPPYPGPWTFDHHPWLEEMHNSKSEDNVGMKGAQLGFTEHLMNIVFYRMDILNQDCLYALPSQNPDAVDFSSGRFNPAIELSEHLTQCFSSTKNMGHKVLRTANLYIRGARSRSGFKSIPVSFIACDEVDEWDPDMIPLVRERMSGQLSKEMWRVSTPGVEDMGIHAQFKESSQDHFFFKCPHCSKFIELSWENMVVTAEDYIDESLSNSHLICLECEHHLDHATKSEWLSTGRYVSKVRDRAIRGFHINQLYSSTVTAADIAASFLRARISPSDEQEFFNSKLGLPHSVEGARVDESQIESSLKNHLMKDEIKRDGFYTIGIDVGTWLHYEITQWFFDSSDYNAHFDAMAKVVKVGKVQHFDEIGDLIRLYAPIAAVVDANPERREALRIANEFWGVLKLCFYGNSCNGRDIHVSTAEPTVTVDRTSWLDLALGRWKNGTIKLPADTPEEYKRHIKALVRRYEKDKQGNPVARYVNTGPDHFAHARCYSEIAFENALNVQGVTPITRTSP